MSLEGHQPIAVVAPPALTRPEPPVEARSAELLARSPEEIRAVEAVFAQQDHENTAVAGLLNVWTGAMVLRDVLADTFKEPVGEVEAEPKENKKPA